MKRIKIEPRADWPTKIEACGFDFYHIDGIPYWHEAAYYELTAAEVDTLEGAGNAVHRLYLRAVERVISEKLYPLLGIEPAVGDLIGDSWGRTDPAIYGRFDFIWDQDGLPKLLEYNADTPSSLFEASIVQWKWKEEVFPSADQFNSIHESLIERWSGLLRGRYFGVDGPLLYITTATPHAEDECTVKYMGAIAEEAGYKVKFLPIQQIGWNGAAFTDLDEKIIQQIFKLYPWEWIIRDEFGSHVRAALWYEPPWKMLLSNKGLLPLLWEMFPEHENLLSSQRIRDNSITKYVEKPILGREGANVTIYDGDRIIQQTPGTFAAGPFIYQAMADSLVFNNTIRPNFGVWMANDRACGLGVREDDSLIVSNGSRFVPHIFS